MSSKVWMNLALTMQDPATFVRSQFGRKAIKTLSLLSSHALLINQQMQAHLTKLQQTAAINDDKGLRSLALSFGNLAHQQARLSVHSAKLASFLSLAGMDPHRPNLEAAARSLRLYCIRQRPIALTVLKLQEQFKSFISSLPSSVVSKANLPSSVATPPLPASFQPEISISFLIYLLAHHPDMPRVSHMA